MTRPYFHQGIGDLEQLFSNHPDDPSVLASLRIELTHRKRKRATLLKQRVDDRLRRLTSAGGSSLPLLATARRPSPNISPTQAAKTARLAEQVQPLEHTPAPTGPAVPLLDSWTALEVLSPSLFVKPEDLAGGDRNAVARVSPDYLPWAAGRRSKKNCRLYYQVVLGTVRAEEAVSRLLEKFGDTRAERPQARGRAALATVTVDQRGVPVERPAVAVSSFGWGVTKALDDRLDALCRWPKLEADVTDRLEARFRRPPRPGSRGPSDMQPLAWADLLAMYELVVSTFGLPPDLIEPPTFAVCSYTYFRSNEPPEPLIINSFYLNDLAAARKFVLAGKEPSALGSYLGRTVPPCKRDLLSDTHALRHAVSPSRTPAARWPGPSRRSLSLLQQAAVNVAADGMSDHGLLGINGPPGTGKTTLLRDIVAHVICRRGEVLCQFDDPATAFSPSGIEVNFGGNNRLLLHRLAEALRGHEIVVASSNNRAVENVSSELPALEAVADDAPGLRYFASLASVLHGRSTWGLVAGLLGNAANRATFRRTFWWDEDVGMQTYLTAAAGGSPQVIEHDPLTGLPHSRLPRIVSSECPPTNAAEARKRWAEARGRFRAALATWHTWLESLTDVEREISLHPGKCSEAESAEQRTIAAQASLSQATSARETAEHRAWIASIAFEEAKDRLQQHREARPGWWERMWGTGAATAWKREVSSREGAVALSEAEFSAAENATVKTRGQQQQASNDLAVATGERDRTAASRAESEAYLATARAKGIEIIDDAFFRRTPGEQHVSSPWLPPAAQTARDSLFEEAVKLHRAFIDAAADPIRQNLAALMRVLGGRRLPNDCHEGLLADLWATLFLVVPLVSTTFASVERMFGRLGPGTLGWLLVDEAGQATPQAAVGAVMRARRALFVGDPVQIEPVVTLPDQLIRSVCAKMLDDADQMAAPLASAQTLADNASPFGAEFPMRDGRRTVGVPLLVHRRCASPMFEIANAVAYAGRMVSAKTPELSRIRDTLGPSAWLDVQGYNEDKWCENEGREVVRLLNALSEADIEPDLYVVTPFRMVAERLRRFVIESKVLARWHTESADARRWVSTRIGTVHTAQGREAEAVIFVLGAAADAHAGARAWAGGRPNLLNVAVTRAKEVLYVIGNRQKWADEGVFRVVDRTLPR
jgi:hypothetical protein